MESHLSRGARGLRLAPGLAGVLALAALAPAGCSKPPTAPSAPATPTAPAGAPPPPALQRIELEIVESNRMRPQFRFALTMNQGQTAQLRAWGYQADGSALDVTTQVSWEGQSPPFDPDARSPVSVQDGQVLAHDIGFTTLYAIHPAVQVRPSVNVWVIPAGTFVVAGYVFDAKSTPVTNALVEMVGGQHAIQRGTTSDTGFYRVHGIPTGAELRAARGSDYIPVTQRVALTDHDSLVDFRLVEAPSLTRIDGTYTLTVTADATCAAEFRGLLVTALPDSLKVRAYSATVSQVANSVTVVLAGPTIQSTGRFPGTIEPGSATLALGDAQLDLWYDGLWYANVSERLSPSTYLLLEGEATISTSTLSGTLDGSLLFFDVAKGVSPIAACRSSTHQFRLTR